MRKCYIITAHNVSKTLAWTIEYLSSFQENTILIHYDKKSNIDELLVLIKDFDNVFAIKERVNVSWGRFSQVEATLLLLSASMQYSYEYLFFISGEDIPAMNNSDVNTFLESNYGQEFIHFQDERNTYVDPFLRVFIKYPSFYFIRHPSFFNRVLRKLMRPLLPCFFRNELLQSLMEKKVLVNFYKGTNWFTLTRACIIWILDYIERNPSLLVSFGRSIFIDEVFFHSIIALNKNLIIYDDKTKINNALRYIDWKSGPQYPRLLNLNDFDAISRSQVFFARKINHSVMSESEFEFFKKLVM